MDGSEYHSLREEMISAFDRVNRTLLFSLGAYGVFISYYLNSQNWLSDYTALIFLLLLTYNLSSFVLKQYSNIYRINSYIAYNYESIKEGDDETHSGNPHRWHRMNSQFDSYCKQKSIKLDVGFIDRHVNWGSDLRFLSILTALLTGAGVLIVASKANIGNLVFEFFKASRWANGTMISLNLLLIVLIFLIAEKVYIMFTFREKELKLLAKSWQEYSKDFGVNFTDEYSITAEEDEDDRIHQDNYVPH